MTISVKNIKKITIIGFSLFMSIGCFGQSKSNNAMDKVIEHGLRRATIQSLNMAKSLEKDTRSLPRSFQQGQLITSNSRWWCSGFFPGTLWYLYENTPTDELKKYAVEYTNRVEREKYTTDNHDVGFMIYCSFGNGLRLTKDKSYEEVILQASKSLSTRYKKDIGLIRSWDQRPKEWQYPVIIDNMMNLEMLMWAAKHSGDSKYREIAINHADRTMKEHFRKDYSCYHLVDYDTITGASRLKRTVQGFSASSAWARGQAWALYGYTMMYRETGEKRFLNQAENVARYIINHPRLPKDKVPYWDFDAPNIPKALRDASAGAIMASAFIELSEYLQDESLAKACMKTAETALRTLTSSKYLAKEEKNGNFILMHSVGSIPGDSEIDVPLTYADYYYVEALMRYKKKTINNN